MLFRDRRLKRATEVETLALELEHARVTHQSDEPRVAIASALGSSAAAMRETPRAQAKARMLRAYDAAGQDTRPDAGTQDLPDYEVHTITVNLPDGGTVALADVERIEPAQAARIAERVLDARAGLKDTSE